MAIGDENLAAHQVDAGHDFGDRVLDLDTGIDFDEVELAAIDIEQELDGPGAAISHRLAESNGRLADPLAKVVRERDARRDFDDLLVPPLHGAVTLPQVDEVAVRIAEDLDFDVLRPRYVPLEKHVRPAERRCRFALRFREPTFELVGSGDDAHPPSAAAEARLDHDGVADSGRLGRSVREPAERRVGTRYCRDAGRACGALGCRLVAEQIELLRSRTDEENACFVAGSGERRALRQEAIPGVNGIDAVLRGHADDVVDVQVGLDRLTSSRRSDHERFVGFEPVEAEPILVAVDGDRAQPELGGGSEASDCNFRSVGDEEFSHPRESRNWPAGRSGQAPPDLN